LIDCFFVFLHCYLHHIISFFWFHQKSREMFFLLWDKYLCNIINIFYIIESAKTVLSLHWIITSFDHYYYSSRWKIAKNKNIGFISYLLFHFFHSSFFLSQL
jgi:hypothetical protein